MKGNWTSIDRDRCQVLWGAPGLASKAKAARRGLWGPGLLAPSRRCKTAPRNPATPDADLHPPHLQPEGFTRAWLTPVI